MNNAELIETVEELYRRSDYIVHGWLHKLVDLVQEEELDGIPASDKW